MFWFLAVLSTIGFGLNYVFITKLVRDLPSFQSIAYRGFGLAITIAPFLLLVPREQFLQIPYYLPQILGGSFFTTLSLWLYFKVIKSIPLGIASSLRSGFGVVIIALLGILILQNQISHIHWTFILTIIFTNLYLGFSKSDTSHLITVKNSTSFILSILSGVSFALGYFMMMKVSQEFSPYLSGYLWEVGIALIGLIISLCTREYKQKKFSWKTYRKMAIASSPTVLATLGAALAATMGPIGIVGAIQSGSIIVISVLSVIIFKERLKYLQWVAITIMTMAIIGFKIF